MFIFEDYIWKLTENCGLYTDLAVIQIMKCLIKIFGDSKIYDKNSKSFLSWVKIHIGNFILFYTLKTFECSKLLKK